MHVAIVAMFERSWTKKGKIEDRTTLKNCLDCLLSAHHDEQRNHASDVQWSAVSLKEVFDFDRIAYLQSQVVRLRLSQFMPITWIFGLTILHANRNNKNSFHPAQKEKGAVGADCQSFRIRLQLMKASFRALERDHDQTETILIALFGRTSRTRQEEEKEQADIVKPTPPPLCCYIRGPKRRRVANNAVAIQSAFMPHSSPFALLSYSSCSSSLISSSSPLLASPVPTRYMATQATVTQATATQATATLVTQHPAHRRLLPPLRLLRRPPADPPARATSSSTRVERASRKVSRRASPP